MVRIPLSRPRTKYLISFSFNPSADANSSAISGRLQGRNSASGQQRRIWARNGSLSGPESLIANFGGTDVSPPDRRFLHGRPGQRTRDAPVSVGDGAHSQRLSKKEVQRRRRAKTGPPLAAANTKLASRTGRHGDCGRERNQDRKLSDGWWGSRPAAKSGGYGAAAGPPKSTL